MRGTWFLHVEVKHLKRLCIPCPPGDAAVLSKHKDLKTCNGEDKAKCNSEENKMEGFQPRSCFAEEHETTNHVSKKLNKKRIAKAENQKLGNILNQMAKIENQKLGNIFNQGGKIENRKLGIVFLQLHGVLGFLSLSMILHFLSVDLRIENYGRTNLK